MILIAAGSSLPFCGTDSQHIVLHGFSALGRIATLKRTSALYETPAWPDPDNPPFINAAAEIDTAMPPESLIAALHAIEAGFGRRRGSQNAPRTLDLDLIVYHEERRSDPGGGLILPHPRYRNREFVLAPVCDIAPAWRDPETGLTAKAMLAALPSRQARRIS